MSKDIVQFARALDFAAEKHVHQRRKGELEEPYINHLVDVTRLLAAATEGRPFGFGLRSPSPEVRDVLIVPGPLRPVAIATNFTFCGQPR